MNSTVSNSLFHYTHACRQAVVRLKTFYKFHASSPFLLFDRNGELVFFELQEMHFIRKIPVQFRQNFDFIFNVSFIIQSSYLPFRFPWSLKSFPYDFTNPQCRNADQKPKDRKRQTNLPIYIPWHFSITPDMPLQD